jgi:hypothetical protein
MTPRDRGTCAVRVLTGACGGALQSSPYNCTAWGAHRAPVLRRRLWHEDPRREGKRAQPHDHRRRQPARDHSHRMIMAIRGMACHNRHARADRHRRRLFQRCLRCADAPAWQLRMHHGDGVLVRAESARLTVDSNSPRPQEPTASPHAKVALQPHNGFIQHIQSFAKGKPGVVIWRIGCVVEC